jgi:hypothetical protein
MVQRSGDKMHLGPEQTAAFIRRVLAEGTYVVCHVNGLLPTGTTRTSGRRSAGAFSMPTPLGRSPALRLRPPDRGRPAPAGPTRGRTGPVTRAETVKQLQTLGPVTVRDLAVPAVTRPHRDGWLIFPRDRPCSASKCRDLV